MALRRLQLAQISGSRFQVFPAILAAFLCMHVFGEAAADEPRAEYAVRWMPSSGTPATPEHVLKVLGLKEGKSSKYDVQYFAPSLIPKPMPGFEVVLRERVGKKMDVTWKYRGPTAPPQDDQKTWLCPLLKEDKRKDELDVSIGSAGAVKRAFSRSCTAEQRLDKALPTDLKVAKQGCKGEVKVLESKDGSVNVELWNLTSGQAYLELSSKGGADDATLAAFKKVVAKLTASGVQPLDKGMTEIATQCTGK